MSALCEAIAENLQAYGDGECEDPIQKAVVEDHIAQCGPCRARLGELQGIGLALKAFYEASAGLEPGPRETLEIVDEAVTKLRIPSGTDDETATVVAELDEGSTPSLASTPPAATPVWGAAPQSGGAPPPARLVSVAVPPSQPAAVPEPLAIQEKSTLGAGNRGLSIPGLGGPLSAELGVSSSTGVARGQKRKTKRRKKKGLGVLIGRELGGYRIEAELASGGMGTVFRAIQMSMERPVALKVLAPELRDDEIFVKRFEQEARAAAKLDHPNIVRIFDVGRDQNYIFFSMELVEGQDIKEIIAEKGALEPEAAVRYAIQCCRALEVAAAAGIAHRDIKPGNMLVAERDDSLKLADLGLAKMAASNGDGSITIGKVVMGSPNYMSPEQAEDVRKADHQSDVYSLGASLYEMLTGKRPFGRGSPVEILARMLTQELDFGAENHKVDLALVLLVRKAMKKDRAERYQNAKEFRAELEAYQQTLGSSRSRHRRRTTAPNEPLATPRPQQRSGRSGKGVRPRSAVAKRPSVVKLVAFLLGGFLSVALVIQLIDPGDTLPTVPPVESSASTSEPSSSVKGKPKEPQLARGPRVASEAQRQIFDALSKEFGGAGAARMRLWDQLEALAGETKGSELGKRVSRFMSNKLAVAETAFRSLLADNSPDPDDPTALRQSAESSLALAWEYPFHNQAKMARKRAAAYLASEQDWTESTLAKLIDAAEFGKASDAAAACKGVLKGARPEYAGLALALLGKAHRLAWDELREQQRKASGRLLATLWERSFKHTRSDGLSALNLYADKLTRELEGSQNPEFLSGAQEHLREIRIVSSVLDAAAKKLVGKRGKRLSLELEDGRKLRGLLRRPNDVDFVIESGEKLVMFKVAAVDSRALLRWSALENQAAAAIIFLAYRGRTSFARRRLQKLRALDPRALAGFDPRLALFRRLASRRLLSNLLESLKSGQPASEADRALHRRLGDEFPGILGKHESTLVAWLGAKPQPKLAPAKKKPEEPVLAAAGNLAKLRKLLPVVNLSPAKDGRIAIRYDFKNKDELDDWYHEFPFAERLRDRIDKSSYGRPALFQDREHYSADRGVLWAGGWERFVQRVRFAPGPLRIELRGKVYQGSLGAALGLGGEHALWAQAGMTLPQIPFGGGKRRRKGGGPMGEIIRKWSRFGSRRHRIGRDAEFPATWEILAKSVDLRPAKQGATMNLTINVEPVKKGERWRVLMSLGRKRICNTIVDEFPAGQVAIQTWSGYSALNMVRITGRVDGEWLEQRLKEREEEQAKKQREKDKKKGGKGKKKDGKKKG